MFEPWGATLPMLGAKLSVAALLEVHVSVTDWPLCTVAGAACSVTVGRAGGGAAGGGGGGGYSDRRLFTTGSDSDNRQQADQGNASNDSNHLEILLLSFARARA